MALQNIPESIHPAESVCDFPVVPMASHEPLQDYYQDQFGNYYSVAKLIDDTQHLQPFHMPLAGLDLCACIWQNRNMLSLAYHCKRVMEADLTKPIIIAWDGSIADGRHRIIKALIEGNRTILAVRMTWHPVPCRKETT